MKKIFGLIAIVLTMAAGCSTPQSQDREQTEDQSISDTASKEHGPQYGVESIRANHGEGLYAYLDTRGGDILIRLAMEKAPMTTANFVALAKGEMPNDFRKIGEPYFDGLKFHRVISLVNGDDYNFMIQGGDPTGTGGGGPGYQFRDEFHPSLRHDRPGVLSMANSGVGTNGSQFFITIVPVGDLDGKHSVFGYVVEGQKNVNRMLKDDQMNTVRIIAVGEAAENFNAMETFNALKDANPNS